MRPINLRYERLQRRVEDTMLPQSAEIVVQTPGYNDAGMRSKASVRRLIYKGSSTIPCRLDVSKHYRQADIQGQEVNVTEFTIHFPRAVLPAPDSKVVVDGISYENRKLLDSQAWDTTTQSLLVRVNKPTLVLPLDALTDGDDGYLLTGAGGRILLG